jgi:hypothetical protein
LVDDLHKNAKKNAQNMSEYKKKGVNLHSALKQTSSFQRQ